MKIVPVKRPLQKMQSTSLLEQVKVMWSSMETRATCKQIQNTSGELNIGQISNGYTVLKI